VYVSPGASVVLVGVAVTEPDGAVVWQVEHTVLYVGRASAGLAATAANSAPAAARPRIEMVRAIRGLFKR
jgi:hypothetical protein